MLKGAGIFPVKGGRRHNDGLVFKNGVTMNNQINLKMEELEIMDTPVISSEDLWAMGAIFGGIAIGVIIAT